MYPQVIQLETRRRLLMQALKLPREQALTTEANPAKITDPLRIGGARAPLRVATLVTRR